jgi:hypothetical protein
LQISNIFVSYASENLSEDVKFLFIIKSRNKKYLKNSYIDKKQKKDKKNNGKGL